MGDQRHQCKFRRIGPPIKHGFGRKHPPDRYSINAANQCAAVQHFDTMVELDNAVIESLIYNKPTLFLYWSPDIIPAAYPVVALVDSPAVDEAFPETVVMKVWQAESAAKSGVGRPIASELRSFLNDGLTFHLVSKCCFGPK